MAETIDKQTFAVDMKLVWACAVGIGYIVYTGTTKLNDFDARLAKLEEAPARVTVLEDEQRRTAGEVKELQTTMNNIKTNLETMSVDVKALTSQMQILVQSAKK